MKIALGMSSATVEPHEKIVGCCAWAIVVRVPEYAEREHGE